jgi:hypothetical protein
MMKGKCRGTVSFQSDHGTIMKVIISLIYMIQQYFSFIVGFKYIALFAVLHILLLRIQERFYYN